MALDGTSTTATLFSPALRSRRALYLCLYVSAMIVIPSIALRVQAFLFQRRAVSVVSALSALRVGTSSEAEAMSRIPTLKADGMGPYGAPVCDADECVSTGIPYSSFSYAVLTRVGRAGSPTLFSALSRWGVRLSSLSVFVNFKSGKVSYLSYNLMVSTPHLDPPDAVVVEVTSREHEGARKPGLSAAEHPDFRVTTARRWPAQSVGVDFSPEAPKGLVEHAFDLELRCLWSFAGCRSWNQLLPAVDGQVH
jgi:hypothetical protein